MDKGNCMRFKKILTVDYRAIIQNKYFIIRFSNTVFSSNYAFTNCFESFWLDKL